jgi:hypothetical protein
MRYTLSLLGILLILLSTTINAGTIDPNVPDSKYLEYGKKHECVFQVKTLYETLDNGKEIIGSGCCVLISPEIIITAAHVIYDAEKILVLVPDEEDAVVIDYTFIPVPYKEDAEANRFSMYDIAICHLKRPISLDYYPPLYKKHDEVGKICSMAGFGRTGSFKSSKRKSDNKKRAGSNFIDKIFKGQLLCTVGNNDMTSLEFLICQGDSGGGLFIDKKLAGINSAIMASDGVLDGDQGDESIHTRISTHYDWIEKVIEYIKQIERVKIDNGYTKMD